MPDPALSAAIKEAYASAPSDVVIVDTLEIRHPAFTVPIRVTTQYAPISARLEGSAPLNAGSVVEFQPFAFDFVLPEVVDTGIPELQITIDNVSKEILQHIELAMPQPEKLEVTYRAFLSNDLLGGPQNDPPLHMTISSIEADAMAVRAKATIADFMNKKFPGENYTDTKFPGLTIG